jgi:serine beta-lactamase-like protein LACTB, mitochondrial
VSRSRTESWLAVIVGGIGLVVAAVLGLWAYVSITATPLHSDAQKVPSVPSSSAPLPQWADAVERARQIVRTDLTQQNLPGVSVAVGVGDEIVWAEGFGYADLEQKQTVTPAMRFRIGNVSNTFTSAAAGLLLEKHQLNFDSEIQTYVPAFPKKPWPVTVRQLMGHVAGIRNDAGDEESLEHCDETADGLRRFADHALRFEPGTQSSPSSYGWILVSAAIETAAHQPFFTFMRTQVFEPLGMSSTRPDSSTETIPDRVTFYFPRFAGDTRYGPELAREGDHSCFAGAGAFLSTPSDVVRFGMAVSSGKLLQPATVTLLQTPQRLASGQETGYGLGWTLERVPLAGEPTRMASHGTKPDFIGTTASLLTFPEHGIVVAVTTNTAFADTRSIGLSIAQAFAEQKKTSGK